VRVSDLLWSVKGQRFNLPRRDVAIHRSSKLCVERDRFRSSRDSRVSRDSNRELHKSRYIIRFVFIACFATYFEVNNISRKKNRGKSVWLILSFDLLFFLWNRQKKNNWTFRTFNVSNTTEVRNVYFIKYLCSKNYSTRSYLFILLNAVDTSLKSRI